MSENRYVVGNKNLINNSPSGTKISYDFSNSLDESVLGILCFILVVIATLVLIGYIIQYTWNKTIPDIFSVKEITLYQAIGLFIL